MIRDFYDDVQAKPVTRMTVRMLEGNDRRREIKLFILDELAAIAKKEFTGEDEHFNNMWALNHVLRGSIINL